MINEPTSATSITDADIKRTTAIQGQALSLKAQGAADQFSQMLGTMGDRVMEFQQEYGQKAREQVRARPLAALGAAVAIGVVLSKILKRR